MKFGGQVGCVTRTKWLDFYEDPDLDPTTRIFKVILHQWEIRPKMICSMISQKIVDRFGWNFVDTLGVWQGRIDSILVKIWIRIWIRELLNYLKWFFTVKRSGQKPISSMISEKVVDGFWRNLVDKLSFDAQNFEGQRSRSPEGQTSKSTKPWA